MKYSKIFLKTNKDAKEYDSINATLLQKASYIDQVMAGVYTYLPLGVRVLAKIENLVRKEMDSLGSEILMPSMVPSDLWKRTNRLGADILLSATPTNKKSLKKNKAGYILSPTHEEVVTPLAQKTRHSYKDFPFAVYQIQTKFRNEERPKSGLLRGREFRMKDLYSFHADKNSLEEYYEKVKMVYSNIFEALGLKDSTVIAKASGGDFTTGYSHEFQVKCDSGEDLIFEAKESNQIFNKEIAPSQAPEIERDEKQEELKEVESKEIVGVEKIANFLSIPIEKTTKTLLYIVDGKRYVATVVRGDYNINESKLKKVLGCNEIKLACSEDVKNILKTEIDYVGILNLPKDVELIIDEAVGKIVNFECGINKTNYYAVNVNFGRDIPIPETFYDIKTAKLGDLYPETKEKYITYKASEAGNIFPLNTKFSKSFGYSYLDKDGKEQDIYMGSYGLGLSRLMGILVEKFHDDKGIIWPDIVSPFRVHLIGLNLEDDEIKNACESVYQELIKTGIEVLYDDRVVSAGEKFADADLIGITWRAVISPKTNGKIEIKRRDEEEMTLVDSTELLDRIS